MDGGQHRIPYHANPSFVSVPTRRNIQHSTGMTSHDRHFQPVLSTTRSDFGRSLPDYGPGFSNPPYHDHQLVSQHMQSSSPMQGIETQYSPFLHNGARSHQTHHSSDEPRYNSYSQGTMLPPMQQSTMFEPVNHFQTRQPSFLESMNSHFSTPSTFEPANNQSIVCNSGTISHYSTSQPDISTYQPVLSNRTPTSPLFTPAANTYTSSQQVDVPEYHQQGQAQQNLNTGLAEYEQQLRATFDSIIAGRLNEASDRLLALTRWLLASVEQLGFHFDNETEHENRLSMWRNFNHCWEALAQKEKNVIQEETRLKRGSPDKLTGEKITMMVDELVSLCDRIESFGLIDYEMGVWEDQIVSAFISCLDLLNGKEKHPTKQNPS